MANINNGKAPPFVMVRRDLLKDKEWRQLSNSAKIIWIYMRAKFNKKTKSDAQFGKKIEITLTYSEIKDMFSTATVSKCFKELETKGWIKKTKHGGLYGGSWKYKFTGKYRYFHFNNKK